MSAYRLTDEEIEKLLDREEGQAFEAKRVEKKPSDILPTICAFANSDGGIMVYGLADIKFAKGRKRLLGIGAKRDHVDELRHLITKEFVPPIPDIKDAIVRAGEVELFIIRIERSANVHSLRKGPTYIRRGARNVQITHEESLRLQYEKGAVHWEQEKAAGLTLDDLDQDRLREWAESVESKGDVEQLLIDNKLGMWDAGKFSLLNAAVVVFGKNPALALGNKSSIRVVHYVGLHPQRSGRPNFAQEPFTVEGSAIDQIKQAHEYLSKIRLVRLQGALFRRKRIPEFALQEAITNAVIHRDYSIAKHTLVSIFDDRIEVESPGWFPGNVTPQNILVERFARNPIIERTLSKFPDSPNLEIGEGVDRMFAEMDRQKLYAPRYASREKYPHSVHLTLFNIERRTEWEAVKQLLEQQESISNRDVRAVTNLDTLGVSELLKDWSARGLLERVPGGGKRNARYRLPGSSGQASLLDNLF